MNKERLTELAELDALGILDGADLAEFKAVNPSDPAMSEVLASPREIAALIGLAQSSAEAPPRELKSRILAQIKGRPPQGAFNPFYFINANEGQWQTLSIAGVKMKNLAEDKRRGLSVQLYQLAPGASFPRHRHTGPEECYVVSGDFCVEGRTLHAGDFHHAEEHSDHSSSHTEGGCTLLIVAMTDDYK